MKRAGELACLASFVAGALVSAGVQLTRERAGGTAAAAAADFRQQITDELTAAVRADNPGVKFELYASECGAQGQTGLTVSGGVTTLRALDTCGIGFNRYALSCPQLAALPRIAGNCRELFLDEMPDCDLGGRLPPHLESFGGNGSRIRNLAPVLQPDLRHLSISGMRALDFSCFRDYAGRLRTFAATDTALADIGFLRGMPLRLLTLDGTWVSDFAPLAGHSLDQLSLKRCVLRDLGFLREVRVRELWLDDTAARDLSPLRGMPLQWLDLAGIPATDFAPLEGMRLEHLTVPAAAELPAAVRAARLARE